MTAPVPRFATDDDHLLLEGYARFCHQVALPDRALRERLRLPRLFLAEHPDLGEWMARPTRSRLADLRRIKAWPLLSWAGLSGLVRLDLDLLAAKDLGGMSATVRQLWPEDFERLWETARRLGWSYYHRKTAQAGPEALSTVSLPSMCFRSIVSSLWVSRAEGPVLAFSAWTVHDVLGDAVRGCTVFWAAMGLAGKRPGKAWRGLQGGWQFISRRTAEHRVRPRQAFSIRRSGQGWSSPPSPRPSLAVTSTVGQASPA